MTARQHEAPTPPQAGSRGSTRPAPSRATSPYLEGPVFDAVFLYGAPIVAVVACAIAEGYELFDDVVMAGGVSRTLLDLSVIVFVNAHLVLAFARSHLNRRVFRAFPWRFTLVPLALMAAFLLSPWAATLMVVLVVWWDVYHSSMQTFGLARIYDRKAGNDPHVGRRLDIVMNLLIYAGPILGGATFLSHIASFHNFNAVGAAALASVPAKAPSIQSVLTFGVAAFAALFVPYYLLAWRRLARAGYRVARPKVWLLASTAVCSVVYWGFNPFGDAFIVMNLFHAWQYFAIVWVAERANLRALLRLQDARGLRALLPLALVVAATIGYGVWVSTDTTLFAMAVLNVVALMHFWYDGFIWSVRRGEAP
jgi:hypothetical protein